MRVDMPKKNVQERQTLPVNKKNLLLRRGEILKEIIDMDCTDEDYCIKNDELFEEKRLIENMLKNYKLC